MEGQQRASSIVRSDIGIAFAIGSLLELLFIAASFSMESIPSAQAWLAITQQPAAMILAHALRGGSATQAVVLLGLTQAIAYGVVALGVTYCIRLRRLVRLGTSMPLLHRDVKIAMAVGYGTALLLAIKALADYGKLAGTSWIEDAQMPGSLIAERLCGHIETYLATGSAVLVQGAIFSFLLLAAIYVFRGESYSA